MRGENVRLDELVSKVRDFHGHFGPFAALGLRLSLYAMEKLKAQRGDERLKAKVTLTTLKTPYTCILDGVQIATGCTIGNGRLRFEEGEKVSLELNLEGVGAVKVEVPRETLEWMRETLKRGVPLEEAARQLLAKPEKEVFV
ncbi:MAG: hypothetical protein DRO46_02370 [Candidatus Hecatellales archaeon]|nr:MAG: hypothetical protein DRO46_02370 [Candidatus Hecatellales archaeon]